MTKLDFINKKKKNHLELNVVIISRLLVVCDEFWDEIQMLCVIITFIV